MASYPRTAKEWWQSLEDNWDKVLQIIMNYYPNQEGLPSKGWPVEMAAGSACNQICQALRKEKPMWTNKDFLQAYVTRLKDTRDPTINDILQSSWFGMPESPWIRETPGFFQFCDLCSESYLILEGE